MIIFDSPRVESFLKSRFFRYDQDTTTERYEKARTVCDSLKVFKYHCNSFDNLECAICFDTLC